MKKNLVWWVVGLVLLAVVVVVGFVTTGDDDEDDPVDAKPTAAASQPVKAPETDAPKSGAPGSDDPDSDGSGNGAPKTSAPPAVLPSPSKPVSLDATAPIDAGARAQITGIKSVTSEAVGPGEISGPAIQVTMRISAGNKKVDLADVVVNGYYGSRRTPAVPVMRPGGKPFTGVVEAGEDATGVYVFNVPKNARPEITIELFFSASAPPVLFTGSA
jgi:hypothetical protein